MVTPVPGAGNHRLHNPNLINQVSNTFLDCKFWMYLRVHSSGLKLPLPNPIYRVLNLVADGSIHREGVSLQKYARHSIGTTGVTSPPPAVIITAKFLHFGQLPQSCGMIM